MIDKIYICEGRKKEYFKESKKYAEWKQVSY